MKEKTTFTSAYGLSFDIYGHSVIFKGHTIYTANIGASYANGGREQEVYNIADALDAAYEMGANSVRQQINEILRVK